jgi:hypothetical protein
VPLFLYEKLSCSLLQNPNLTLARLQESKTLKSLILTKLASYKKSELPTIILYFHCSNREQHNNKQIKNLELKL